MSQKICLIFLLLISVLSNMVHSLHLKQILVLSRHNVRTPLSYGLETMTPKIWPKWNTEKTHLTQKGALLEGYMGEYFSEWLNQEKLLLDGCPLENDVYILSDSSQRTIATAEAFTEAAFPNCAVAVNHNNQTKQRDSIFLSHILNKTNAFKQLVIHEMQDKLNNTNLTDVYKLLNDIAYIKNFEMCKKKGYCDLTTMKNEIVFKIGQEPNITGALLMAYEMVDNFMMSYYEGFPMIDIAWGEIHEDKQWETLAKVLKANLDMRVNLQVAKYLARPLLKYIKERLETEVKFTLLVGHDTNLSPVVSAMGFEPYVLPGQYETIPIGGKIVFQRWTDDDGLEDYLKVEYVYQSVQQLRDAQQLSLSHQPRRVPLYTESCIANKCGYCAWSDFERLLKDLIS